MRQNSIYACIWNIVQSNIYNTKLPPRVPRLHVHRVDTSTTSRGAMISIPTFTSTPQDTRHAALLLSAHAKHTRHPSIHTHTHVHILTSTSSSHTQPPSAHDTVREPTWVRVRACVWACVLCAWWLRTPSHTQGYAEALLCVSQHAGHRCVGQSSLLHYAQPSHVHTQACAQVACNNKPLTDTEATWGPGTRPRAASSGYCSGDPCAGTCRLRLTSYLYVCMYIYKLRSYIRMYVHTDIHMHHVWHLDRGANNSSHALVHYAQPSHVHTQACPQVACNNNPLTDNKATWGPGTRPQAAPSADCGWDACVGTCRLRPTSCKYVWMYVCIYSCMYECMHVCMQHAFMHAFMHVCMYVDMYRCIASYIHTYTHEKKQMSARFAHWHTLMYMHAHVHFIVNMTWGYNKKRIGEVKQTVMIGFITLQQSAPSQKHGRTATLLGSISDLGSA